MNRLFSIAEELYGLAHQRFTMRQSIAQIEKDIVCREAAIIPEGGWPGSNADTRKANEKIARAADGELAHLAAELDARKYDMELSDVVRESLIAERSAWEWTIRDRETTSPVEGHKLSVFAEMGRFQDAVDDEPITAPQDPARHEDDIAAQIRTDEMDKLSAACKWEEPPFAVSKEALSARARYDELAAIQNDYETKYGL